MADEPLPYDVFGREILDLAFSSAGPCTDDDGDAAPSGPGATRVPASFVGSFGLESTGAERSVGCP